MYPSYRQLLSPPAYLVMGTLREYIFEGESRTVDYSWLVHESGLAYSSVSKAVKELADCQLIARERLSAGRGHSYRITMLPPPEKRAREQTPAAADQQPASAAAAFAAPQTIPERSQNDHMCDLSGEAESAIPTLQTSASSAPIMNHEIIKQEQQRMARTANGADTDTNEPDIPDIPVQPQQLALIATLHQHNAGLVAEQVARARPELTAADFLHDLEAAQMRPGVYSPVGLVIRVWLAGGRVAPPRQQRPQPAASAPAPAETEAYLLDQGFSPRAAAEFAHCALEAVRPQVAAVCSPLDTASERNRKIGSLVLRWRREPPALPAEAQLAAASAEQDPVGEAVPAREPETQADGAAELETAEPAAAEPAEEIEEIEEIDRSDPAAVWRAVLARLCLLVPRHAFCQWFETACLLSLAPGGATLGCPTRQHKEHLESRYLAPIRRALTEVLGYPVQVRCILLRE
jgi:hypothetical protein